MLTRPSAILASPTSSAANRLGAVAPALLSSALLLLTLGSCSAPSSESQAEPPTEAAVARPFNVVLVSLDTLRADHLGLYGYDRSTSPFLERLAEESVVFDMALSHSSHTAPAHRALFQSQVVSQLSDSAPTLPQILQSSGFRTSAFVGGAKVSPEFGFDRFFDEFVQHFGGFSTASRRVGEWLERPHDRPFFLFVHTYDVHLPYDPPPPYDTAFLPEYQGWVNGPESRLAVQQFGQVELLAEDRQTPNPQDLDKLVALYDGGILYADSQVERLVGNLKQYGHWEDTLFIVLSDHGEEFWDHRGMGHGITLYQEMLHVPLIIHFPQQRFAGTRISEPIGLIDVLPTILEVVGLDADPEHQGASLLPLLRGQQRDRSPILSQTFDRASLIRYPWKLILVDGSAPVLFNLQEDPGERTDLAAAEGDLVTSLTAELEEILGRSPQYEIEGVNPEGIEDEELRQQLEALGYLDGQ